MRNFRERRIGLVAGGCPLLNTAIDSDDGNRQLRAKALASLLDGFQAIANEGKRRGEVRSGVDCARLATPIVSTLEGSLMLCGLEKTGAPLELAVEHLENHLDANVRVPESRKRAVRP